MCNALRLFECLIREATPQLCVVKEMFVVKLKETMHPHTQKRHKTFPH